MHEAKVIHYVGKGDAEMEIGDCLHPSLIIKFKEIDGEEYFDAAICPTCAFTTTDFDELTKELDKKGERP